MKISKVVMLFSFFTMILAGCNISQTDNFIPTIFATTSKTQVLSSPTSEVAETTTISSSLTWESEIREIFEIQCGECHISNPTGGFSVTSYTKLLQGSSVGPVIIPGNPEDSHLFYKLKFGGNHPGYMSKDQTDLVWEWVSNGAPE